MVRARVLAGGQRVAQGESASPGYATTQPQKPAYSRATACSLEGRSASELFSGLPFRLRQSPFVACMIGRRTRAGLHAAAREYAGFCGCVVAYPGLADSPWATCCPPASTRARTTGLTLIVSHLRQWVDRSSPAYNALERAPRFYSFLAARGKER